MLIFPDEFKPVGYPKVFLYTLTDPRDNRIRYVGKTTNPEMRHKQYCNKNPYYHGRVTLWLFKLIMDKIEPIMTIVDYYEEKRWEHKNWIEKSLIEKYINDGHDLLNDIHNKRKNAKKFIS